jgi:hypothetical protein
MNTNKEQTMNNRIKAATFVALYTVGLVVTIGAVHVILNYLQPTLEQVGVAVAVVMLAYAVNMMYDLRLSQLNARDRLREIAKTNPTLK